MHLFFENGKVDVATVRSNNKDSLEVWLQDSMWLKCSDNQRHFNMTKVISFEVQKIDN